MKAAFFYSHQQRTNPNVSLTTIDGLPYTFVSSLEDDEPVVVPNGWPDMALVKVVENVDIETLPLVPEYRSVSLWTGPLAGRVTINGIKQI